MVASYDVLRLAKVCSRKPQNKMLQSHLLTLLIAINDELIVLSDLSNTSLLNLLLLFHNARFLSDYSITCWNNQQNTRILQQALLLLLLQCSSSNLCQVSDIFFTTGGDDKLVKVWDYMEGVVTHIGIAHGGSITSIKLCSNNSTLISTSADGAIVRWRFPHPPSS